MREWGEALLDEGRLRSDGFLDVAAVRGTWDRHLRGDMNLQARLWPILMLQQWLEAEAQPVRRAPLSRAA
jgi:asparagine synthase (glutamine-hydrolysing)